MSGVFVVIPVHNALALTLDCLQSLINTGHPASDVRVVDNGSIDGTADAIRKQFPTVSIVTLANLGYAAAVNVGLEESLRRGFKYTWILNSDTVIPSHALAKLVAFMDKAENDRVGACGPLIYSADQADKIDLAGAWLCRSNWSVKSIDDPHVGESALIHRADSCFLAGSALFVRNVAVLDVGKFDERFFMYWEDVDYCVRLLNSGWQLRLVSSARIFHTGFGSSGRSLSAFAIYYYTRNRFLMWRKHTHGIGNRMRTLLLMTKAVAMALASPKLNRLWRIRAAYAQGLIDGFCGNFGKRAIGKAELQFSLIRSS